MTNEELLKESEELLATNGPASLREQWVQRSIANSLLVIARNSTQQNYPLQTLYPQDIDRVVKS